MTDFLLLSFIFLVAGVLSVPIASRLGLGSVLGYLIAGIAISPLLGALGVDVVSIQHFAEFGVVMMLFLVGLELEPKMLWSMRGRLIGLGGGQVVLTTAVIMSVAMLLGQSWNFALAIGLVLALSSTAIVLQTLNEKALCVVMAGRQVFRFYYFRTSQSFRFWHYCPYWQFLSYYPVLQVTQQPDTRRRPWQVQMMADMAIA